MSHNITMIRYLSGKLTISAGTVRHLHGEHGDNLPLCCFLNDALSESITGDCADPDLVEIHDPRWRSGSEEELHLLEATLRLTHGSAHLLVVLDDGSDFAGYQVSNGNIVKCRTDIRLVPNGE